MSDLPHDERLEFAVLGLALLDEDAYATVSALPAGLWHGSENAKIAEALRTLRARGLGADVTALEAVLREMRAVQAAGGFPVFGELLSTAALPSRLEQHVGTLRELAHQRQVILAAERVGAAARKLRGHALVSFVARELEASGDVHGDREPTELSDAIDAAFRRIEDLSAGKLSGGQPWGFPSLDRLLLPLRGGQLVVLAARPSCGKTSLALNAALSIAERGGRVLFVSLETQEVDLALRVLASAGRVNLGSLSRGQMTEADWRCANEGAQRVSKLPLLIDDDYEATVSKITRKAERLQRRGGLVAIFVDYLQLIEPEGAGRDNREREVAAVARGLKKLAKRLDVPVVALAQLNRDSAKAGAERKPVASDLRESGALEQDADAIVLMHRVGVPMGRVEAIVAKQKNGPTGATWLGFNGPTVTFTDDGEDNGMPRDESAPTTTSGVHAKPRRLSSVATPADLPPLYEGEDDWSERDAS